MYIVITVKKQTIFGSSGVKKLFSHYIRATYFSYIRNFRLTSYLDQISEVM